MDPTGASGCLRPQLQRLARQASSHAADVEQMRWPAEASGVSMKFATARSPWGTLDGANVEILGLWAGERLCWRDGRQLPELRLSLRSALAYETSRPQARHRDRRDWTTLSRAGSRHSPLDPWVDSIRPTSTSCWVTLLLPPETKSHVPITRPRGLEHSRVGEHHPLGRFSSNRTISDYARGCGVLRASRSPDVCA